MMANETPNVHSRGWSVVSPSATSQLEKPHAMAEVPSWRSPPEFQATHDQAVGGIRLWRGRVGVGGSARGPAYPDGPVGANDVLDNDGLTERGPHPLRQDPSDCVVRPTGSKWHNDGDRPQGLGLRRGARSASQCDRNGDGKAVFTHLSPRPPIRVAPKNAVRRRSCPGPV